jgi:hypothetical protein
LTEKYTPEELTKNSDLQEELKRKLGKIVEVASAVTDVSSLTGEYKRKISWNSLEQVAKAA